MPSHLSTALGAALMLSSWSAFAQTQEQRAWCVSLGELTDAQCLQKANANGVGVKPPKVSAPERQPLSVARQPSAREARLTRIADEPPLLKKTREDEGEILAAGTPEAVKSLAEDYLKGGSAADAERVATQGLNRRPDDPALLSMRARARALAGDTEGAVADARRTLALKPDDQIAQLILGNRDSLARAAAKNLDARKPDFGPEFAPEEFSDGGERAQYASAVLPLAAASRGSADASALLLTRRPLPAQAQLLFDSARAKLGLGDLSGAFIDATRSSDLAPDSAAPLVLRAHVSNRRGQPEAAVFDATRALTLEPQSAAALRERAYGHIQLGALDAALRDLEQALRLEPQSGTAHYYRAMALEKLGRPAEALADYERAARFDPGLGAALSDARTRLSAPQTEASPKDRARQRRLFRGGAIAASVVLLLLGLAGSSAGRRLAESTRRHLWDTPAPGASALAGAIEPAPGAVVGGSLRIVRELGRGGMGVVYEAFDETLQRRVALKRLQRDEATTNEDFARFLLEARTVARLRHPRLAEIYTVLEDADVYLVFEYVEGEPLDRVLARRARLPVVEARRALVDVAAALGYAHAQKVIHKDIKPANVVLEPTGGCKVMDFGIAHRSVSTATQLTRTTASGTPPYMSPEQAMGSVSKSSDLYALGVMSYELVTGRRPFAGPDFLEQKLNRQFPAPSSLDSALPRGLDEFFQTALDPDPTKRPKSAEDFIVLLDRASV